MSDSFLEEAATRLEPFIWMLACDLPENSEDKEYFTTLLINHSFLRNLNNLVERLITLLSSSDMDIVVRALNLLYMLSKQTNFIRRLNNDKRQALLSRLTHMAESWGGKENGFGLADCCRDVPGGHFPPSSTTLHFEYYSDVPDNTTVSGKGKNSNLITSIHIENVDKINKTPGEIMDELLDQFNVPADKQVQLFIHIQLAHCFSNRKLRLLCVEARLQALTILIDLNTLDENAHTLLYSGILEELIELLEMPSPDLVNIRAAALNALTSIIRLDGNPHFSKVPDLRLNMIIDITGAGSYYGFLPALVRTWIMILTSTNTDSNSEDFPTSLVTALFSFLYHLASYEAGGEALVSCGMMESLLRVINWPGTELEHITFVIRAVQVVDLMTNIDMEAFQTHEGLTIFINRLEMEVNICRKERPFEITFPNTPSEGSAEASTSTSRSQDTGLNMVISPMEVSSVPTAQELCYGSETEPSTSQAGSSTSNLTSKSSSGSGTSVPLPDYSAARTGKTCLPQRAALLKSMLNFLKKAIQDPAFSDSIRQVMEGSLPSSLKHIISNAEYYGPSLFLLAADVVTVYVFEEPSLLSSLQDNGLTDVILHALLIKDVPATREVLGSLRNIFSALCLNTRGLGSFVSCDPFNIFKVLLSPVYLAAMRRRRSSESMGDIALNLGNAMSELMRYQPSLKVDATYAIIKLLEELCVLGRDPKYVCWRAQNKMDVSPALAPRPSANNEGGSSDKKDEDEASTSSHPQHEDSASDSSALHEKTPIALIDYIVNVMKFLDAILRNSTSDDHCREFVAHDGLVPLLSILGLPNLPVDYPVTTAVEAVISVCRSILSLTHEPRVLKQGLLQLSKFLEQLQPLHNPVKASGSSVLLHELASAPNLEIAFTSAAATPLLHAMGAAHRYVVMFVHVCRTGQSDIQTLLLTHWGSEFGLKVLNGLAELYTSLVWESTLLLALCSDDNIPPGFKFGREDMEKLLAPEMRDEGDSTWRGENMDATNSDSAMEVDGETMVSNEKCSGNRMLPTALNFKYIKQLLGASTRLLGALAELFGLLVKLCVESPTPDAHAVATDLNNLLVSGLNWTILPRTTIPKFKLTFLICSVGFTFSMLFDEKKYAYHIMLQKYVYLGGLEVFFDTFRWALSNGLTLNVEEGLDHPDLIDGTGEFLDAWFMLLEKMVNPMAILDSPHTITMKHGAIYNPFDPMKYLMTIHKLAFDAVMLLWHKKPLKSCGARISESMLAILHHILREEKIMANMSMDLDLTEDQMLRAITMSLGEKIMGDSDRKDAPLKHKQKEEFGIQVLCKEAIDSFTMTALPACLNLVDTLPDTVYRVCDLLITITKRNGELWRDEMLDTLVADIFEKAKYLLEVMKTGENSSQIVSELMNSSAAMKIAGRIHLFTLLFEGPVFQEMRVPCAEMVQRSQILPSLVQLLILGKESLTAVGEVMTPKWLAPLLLLIDLHEEVAMLTQRRDRMYKVTNCIWRWFDLPSGKWTTYSSSNNKIINDAYLNGDAMVRVNCGHKRYMIQFARMSQVNEETANRRPVTMSLVTREKAEGKDHAPKEKNYEKEKIEKMETEDSNVQEEKERKKNIVVQGLGREDTTDIVRACVGLLSIPVDKDTLYAVMRVCLRLTRNFENAMIFAGLGGVRMLLDLTQASSFTGFLRLSTLLIRHVMENPQTLRHAMENVLRTRTLHNIPPRYKELLYLLRNSPSIVTRDPETFLEVANSSLRVDLNILSKTNEEEDIRLLMKTLPSKHTPALPIQEEVSITVVYDLLNCLIRPTPREDPTSTTSATNAMPGASSDGGELQTEQNNSATGLVVQSTGSNSTSGSTSTSGSSITLSNGSSLQLVGHAQRASTAVQQSLRQERLQNFSSTDLLQNEVDDRTQELGLKKMRGDLATCVKINKENKKRPLLPKSAILKILAEAVRSYSGCAKLITDHTYCAGQSEMVTENCTALAFLLDKLLPVTDNPVDRECSTMARMLIAALASCNHSPDAQIVLVAEVKAALLRTLSFPESADKHAQIQLLAGLISTMIDNCPSTPNNTPLSASLKLHQYSSHMNNIVCIMLRKRILTDLARVSHYLDLSSPNMPASVNAALKTLETLSNIVNNPTERSNNNVGKRKTQGNVSEEPAGDETGRDVLTGTTSEATHAQGEETVEDAENTEHDISAASESLEPTSGSQVQEGGDDVAGDEGLEDVTEQLLDWGTGSSEDNLLNASFNMEPEVQNNAVDNEHGGVRNQRSPTYENEEDDTQDADAAESSDSDSDTNVEEDEDDDHDDNSYDDDFHHIPPSHPLVMARQNLEVGSITASQTRRANQQRLYQYVQLNHRNPDPPVIVQRLLGPAVYDIPASTSQSIASIFRGIRVVVMDNGLAILTNSEEQIHFVDQLGYLFGPGLAATLNNIPTALLWWMKESKMLDGDSSLDCVTAVVNSLVPHLEKLRDEELAERREKCRKQQEKEEAKKRKVEDDRKNNENEGRVGTSRYAIHTVPAQWGAWNSRQEAHPSLNALSSGNLRMREQQLLDYEATSCLLVLLFVDKPKLNIGRLHRVLQNLCYHAATREWVIKALLSIMEKCNDCRTPDTLVLPKPRRMSTRSQPHPETAVRNSQPSWLNISLDAALGCRASVFTIVKQPGKRGKSQDAANVTIHPQAAPIVFRHTLDVLISLAKSFPGYFLPLKSRDECKYKDPSLSRLKLSPGSSGSGGSRASRSDGTSFWEMLLKLDSITTTKKGKSVARAHSASTLSSESEGHAITFETSAFGQLLTMLASPVVKRSCLLTDKLLTLLSLIAIGLPEVNPYLRRRDGNSVKKPEENHESVPVSEQHLKLAIDVLTSKSCSEEGLEDATALLLNLANCFDPTRDMILHLLLDGAMELANMVNDHIGTLLQELKAMNRNLKRDENEEMDHPPKGVVLDRFTKDNIIVTAPAKVKTSFDLQLPSMATLTSKTSSQAFFLRILNVIVEIHESVRLAHRRNRENSESLDSFLRSADEGGAGADEVVPGSAMDMISPSIATGHARRASSNAETVHAESSASSRAPSRRQGSRSRESESDHAPTTPGTANVGAPTSAPSTDALEVDSDAEISISTPQRKEGKEEVVLPTLSEQLTLNKLWDTLSSCLLELADTPDHHAVLVLQPAVEAFFLVHEIAVEEHQLAYDGHEGCNTQEQRQRENPAPPEVAIIQPDVAPVSSFPSDNISNSTTQPSPAYFNFNWEVTPSPVTLPPDQQKFLKFAETHRTVLNQILRQSTTHLADGPYAVLVDHTRLLDFDVKRRYFRYELERMYEGIRQKQITVRVRRSHIFEDSFHELHGRSAVEWKNKFCIMFEGEEGQDAGGLLREWYVIISREIFNPMYALFTISPGDRVTYMINSSSHCNPNHLYYFKFVGRVIAKAIYDNKLLECYFTRSFYKHILGILVKYTDMESEDYSFYQGLVYLMEHHVSDLDYDLTFSAEVQEFGVTNVCDLIPNGRNIQVCEQNKMDYIRLVCQMKMTGAIWKQINAFLEGFYDIIPKRLISIFNEQELELLISGLPNMYIEDLRANAEYHKYQPTSLQIQWFWQALRSFDQATRAKFLQFVTGTSKVPLQGFVALEGSNGVQKFQIHRDDRSTDRLPSAHTCFNQLDLPVYETYDKLRTYLLKAIQECSEGFGFA